MAQAKRGDRVRVHYVGKLDDGTVFDSSAGREPLEFRLGGGNVIPGFEDAVIGMSPGESRRQVIPHQQAYGPHREDMTGEIDRQRIPPELDIHVGQQLQVEHLDGRVTRLTVTRVSDASVSFDANHPLAGKDLLFDIELVEIVAVAA